jgi:hypothetical protein
MLIVLEARQIMGKNVAFGDSPNPILSEILLLTTSFISLCESQALPQMTHATSLRFGGKPQGKSFLGGCVVPHHTKKAIIYYPIT